MLTDKETFKDEQLNNVLTPVDQRTVVGYLLLHCMLREERLVINKKHTYRLYTEECLQVRTQRRKKLVRPRMSMAVPELPGDRWSMYFVGDQLPCGRRLRVINIFHITYNMLP